MESDIYVFLTKLFHKTQNNIIMKPTQAASEIKPILTKQAYINKLNRKLKSVGKDAANGLKNEPSKPWWAYSVGRRNLAQRLKMPQKVLQEKFLNERIMSLTTSPVNNQIKNVNLSPDMEIIKITTVVEAIRQKRQKIAQMSEVAENIQAMIGKKRSKRSSHESRNSSTTVKNSRRAEEKKTVVSNKKSRYSKSRPRKEQTDSKSRNSSRKKEVADLKTANSALPSTVFYKRIWEYINGTRPHSDIIGDSLEKNSEKDNSTCTDNDRIATSQSQNDKSQVISPNVKPERDFYKRIWDIINATQAYENSKIRSKRDANIGQSDAASTPLCIQEQTDDYEQLTTNEKRSLDIADTINPSSEISDPDSYISGFWPVANDTQWQPKTATVPLLNAAAKLNDDLTLRPLANIASASEVDDLNKFPDKVEQVDYSSSDNSTGHNSSQEIITDPGPPYSSEESFATSLYLPIERAVDKAPREEDRETPQAENYSSTTPNYDPSKIPYVEISDYSDQQEDKSNQSATAAKYKEYDDDDYGVEQLYNIDALPSKSPNAEIKVEPTESEDEPEISLDANDSRSRCAENKDSPKECANKYDVEDTKLRNNTEDGADVQRSAEDSAEISSSEESENSDFVHFDINEYRKPFNLDEFFKNDPLFKSIRAAISREYAKYDYEKNPPPRTEGSEEVETYATDPKERSQDYFAKNEERDVASDDKDKTEEETDSYEKKETKESEINDENYYPYDDKDFFKRIFEKDKDNDKESSDAVDTEKEFLSRYFTEDVLSQLRDNSTAEEDRQKEESRNKEEIHKTLSKILDKKDQFSRLDDNLNKMVEKGETIPIKYNNYWSLEYESPRRRKAEEEANEGAEEAEEA